MENILSGEISNFGKNLSFVMDHDSGYISSESNVRPDDEKFIISEIIPNAGNNTEDAVDGNSDLKNWEVMATSFINVVNKDESLIKVESLEESCLNKEPSYTSLTPQKKYENPVDPNVSPDLFADEETPKASVPEHIEGSLSSKSVVERKYILKKDYSLLKRAANSLKGVIPPHCMTVVHLSVDEILNKIEANKGYFWNRENNLHPVDHEVMNSSNESSGDECKSLLLTGNVDVISKDWPDVLQCRYHGLHHNRSHLSEELEDLCSKYAQRYVGDETQSSCTVFQNTKTSPMKRKMINKRWSIKSPGRRLSHLARRRITFSSANLQSSSSTLGIRARQILVDAKKLDLLRKKHPKNSPRKTPTKSPRKKTRTPSSSAKKKLAARFRKLTGEIETTSSSPSKHVLSSKRALFQSPDRESKINIFLPSTSGIFSRENDQPNSSKKALFMSPSKSSRKNSPFKRSPLKPLEIASERKRKRSESDDRPSKFPRSFSMDIRPSDSTLKIFNSTLSDSFCSQNSAPSTGELSAAHKKKLQWAVYEALRKQNINPTHNQFKVFASNLARITRRLLPLNAPDREIGTTERMLRITLHHVHAVIKGRSVDEIVQEYLRNKAKTVKPQGYVGIEDFSANSNNNRKPTFNVLQDKANLLESFEKKKLLEPTKPKLTNIQVERIRKAINFGDDDNR